jgi:hypothetical protein
LRPTTRLSDSIASTTNTTLLDSRSSAQFSWKSTIIKRESITHKSRKKSSRKTPQPSPSKRNCEFQFMESN